MIKYQGTKLRVGHIYSSERTEVRWKFKKTLTGVFFPDFLVFDFSLSLWSHNFSIYLSLAFYLNHYRNPKTKSKNHPSKRILNLQDLTHLELGRRKRNRFYENLNDCLRRIETFKDKRYLKESKNPGRTRHFRR